MSITYDKTTKQWTFKEEALKQLKPVNYPEKRYINVKYENARVDRNRYEPRDIEASISTTAGPNKEGLETIERNPRLGDETKYIIYKSFEIPLENPGGNYGDSLRGHLENNLGKTIAYSSAVQGAANNFIFNEQPQLGRDIGTARANEKINNEIIKPDNQKIQELNKKKNAVYDKVVAVAKGTQGGDYLTQKANLEKLKEEASQAGFDSSNISSIFDSYDDFYKAEKIKYWDGTKVGSQPPAGKFSGSYYLENNKELQAAWDEAKKKGDLDILATYENPQNYAQYSYTTVGKKSGKRGNAAEELEAASKYIEKKPTDAEIQGIRDKELGIEYETLKGTEAGTALETATSEKIGVDIKKKTEQFGALAQDVLKETIDEMKKAKQKEAMMSTLEGMSGFGDILNITGNLTNSILADSGIGGYLPGAKKSVEELVGGITGDKTSTIYNWQQYFDNELTSKYDEDIELGLITKKEAEEQIKIEKEFGQKFIDEYLRPRFDQSKTMSEFAEYIDVFNKDEDIQNPFQTQDILNKAAEVGLKNSQVYLDELKKLTDSKFDANFYFDPSNNLLSEEAKKLEQSSGLAAKYAEQKKTVAADWEEAKKQIKAKEGYWYQQAYKYGVDNINDKEAFAKLHFQVKGISAGYDAAEDTWSTLKNQEYIYTTILPAIQAATDNMSVFGNFVKPEDYAEGLLKSQGVNPLDKETWGKVLDSLKLEAFDGSYEDLKTYIADNFKTVSAGQLEKQIKALQEEGITPTQKELGALFIERDEYEVEAAEGQTELFKIFQKSGYKGTEKEFYTDFFPDLDYEEQKQLSKLSKGSAYDLIGVDADDPFAAFSSIDKLLGDEDDGFANIFSMDDDEEDDDYYSGAFTIGLDDDEEETTTKSKSGASILSDFTSYFNF